MKFVQAFLCVALAILPAQAQEFKLVRNGIEYAQFSRLIKPSEKEAPQNATVNALRIDLKKARLDVVHAKDAAIGVETTSSIARRHGAFAAINAGFFRLDRSIFNGEPTGVLQIDGKLLSESFADRVALLIDNDKREISIGRVRTLSNFSTKKQRIDISGINRQRKDNEIILFTPEFSRTTLTENTGAELVIQKDKVQAVMHGKGNNVIPCDGFVLSIGEQRTAEILKKTKAGLKIEISLNAISSLDSSDKPFAVVPFLFWIEDIVGGVPQLIKNGKIEITWEQEKQTKSFVETRHPRTAIAKLKDGRALLVAVDGRSAVSGGMNLHELAEMLLEMGATDAMNLDGGGSTTMFLDGKIVNKPSDKEGERPVSDAILVRLRK